MVVVTRNQGLTVVEATELRRRMRASGTHFRVVKNRLTSRAIAGTRFDALVPLLRGPTALAWSSDPVAVAKAAVEFAKTNEKLTVVGGALGARLLGAEEVKALAELPSLPELRAQLVGLMAAPAQRLAALAAASASGLVRIFGAYAKAGEPS